MSKIVRVLKPGKLLGEERKYGDLLPPEEYFSLPINVQSSLEGANHVEIDVEGGGGGDSNPDLEARVHKLEYQMEQMLPANQAKEDVIPSKGDTVSFLDGDDTIVAEVTSIVKKDQIARVKSDNGKYSVAFEDLTILN